MTAQATIQAIETRLVDAGYEMLGSAVRVGSIPYEFEAVLLGPNETLDLVIVVDSTTPERVSRLRQRVEGLGRALDMAGSKRTVTAVVVGPAPDARVLSAIRSVGRYLLVPDQAESDDLLDDRLAILLPLELDVTTESAPDPVSELLRKLDLGPDDARRALITAASKGVPQVEAELKRFIEAPLRTEREP